MKEKLHILCIILCIILCMHYVRGAFKDFPDKIFQKSATNHPNHLFGVDDDRKFISINKQLFRY